MTAVAERPKRARTISPGAGRTPVGDLGPAVAEHIEWLRVRGLSEKTVRQRTLVLQLLARYVDPTPLLAADAADLDRWQRAMRTSGLAVGSRYSYVVQARGFYRWAARERLLEQDPSLVLVTPKVPRGRPHPVNELDLDSALSMADPRTRAMLALAAGSGLRAAEIAGLRVEDLVDELLRVCGKGSKQRWVPLAPWVREALDAYGIPASGHLFRRADGTGPATPTIVSQTLAGHLHKLGIDDSAHSARHRFATQLYRQTRDIRLVQEILGHASIVTTQIYTEPDTDQATAAIAALTPGGAR